MYLKSAFIVSLATYLLLILAEVLQPGFVSNYFSAHWLLLIALGLFVLLVHQRVSFSEAPWTGWSLTSFVALVFAMVTWRLGTSLGELRFLLVLVALILPFGWLLSLKEE